MPFATTWDALIFIPPIISHFTLHRDIWDSPELAVKMERLGKRSVWISGFEKISWFTGRQVSFKLAWIIYF